MTDADRLTHDVTRGDGRTEVVLRGELDPHTASDFSALLDELCGEEPQLLVIDLAGLTFVDSSGLRAWVQAHHRQADAGRSLVLRSPSDTVQRLLDVTGLTEALTVEP